LNLSDSAISQALNRLSQRQLLRIFSFINLPLLGLIPLEIKLQVSDMKQKRRIMTLLSKTPYIDFIIDTKQFLISRFVIPYNRVDEFKSWIYALRAKENLAPIGVYKVIHQFLLGISEHIFRKKDGPPIFQFNLINFNH